MEGVEQEVKRKNEEGGQVKTGVGLMRTEDKRQTGHWPLHIDIDHYNMIEERFKKNKHFKKDVNTSIII